MNVKNYSRRQFLKSTAIASAGLSLAFSLPGNVHAKTTTPSDNGSNLTAWLHIGSDESITIQVPSAEMGQGVLTALPMIIADELDADWQKVQSQTAPFTNDFNNPATGGRGTGGSSAVRRWWPIIAKAGASAREMLIAVAAAQWQVATADLRTENGFVLHPASQRKASYGSLAAAANKLTPPTNPALKKPQQYNIIGKPAPRLDTPAKVNGSAVFGIDVEVPNMVYATIAASPNFVGELQSMDSAAAIAVTGVIDIVQLPAKAQQQAGIQNIVAVPDAVAVVADSYWHAKKGLQALKPTFNEAGLNNVSDSSLRQQFRQALDDDGIVVRNDGDLEQSLQQATKTISADFEVPFLAHLCMEPMNCTAHYYKKDDGQDHLELWIPTQGQTHTSNILQKALALTAQQITLHTTLMGGAFGRRYEADFALQAALIAKAVARPVKLLWSREEDLQHDYYRPASASRFKVGIDANGLPTAWSNALVCPSVAQRNFAWAVRDGVDPFSLEGAFNIPYAIANQRISLKQLDTSIPVGSWRSVGSSHNGFYVESMMDEVASASGQDPFALRRRLLQKHPRFLKILDTLERESAWQQKPRTGHFRGMAIHESFASIVGEVAEISVDKKGKIKLHKMTCVVDCGQVVNPSIIEQQMESAMIDGLTAALRGGLRIKQGRVEQANFDTYKLMRLAEVPEMKVHIMQNNEAAGGIGEPGVPPSKPALANAIYAATGKRVRSLPIEQSFA